MVISVNQKTNCTDPVKAFLGPANTQSREFSAHNVVMQQVMHMEQAAQLIIHPDSRKPILFDAIDTLAQQRGYPSIRSEATDMTAHTTYKDSSTQMHAADVTAQMTDEDWRSFCDYVKRVDPDTAVHVGYVPVNRHPPTAAFVSPLPSPCTNGLV